MGRRIAELEREIRNLASGTSLLGSSPGMRDNGGEGTSTRNELVVKQGLQVDEQPRLPQRIALTRTSFPNSVYHAPPASSYFPYFRPGYQIRERAVTILIVKSKTSRQTDDKTGKSPPSSATLVDAVRRFHKRTVVSSAIAELLDVGASSTSENTTGSSSTVAQVLSLSSVDPDLPVLLVFEDLFYAHLVEVSTSSGIGGHDQELPPLEEFVTVALSTALHALETEEEVQVVGFPILAKAPSRDELVAQEGSTSLDRHEDGRYYLWEPRRINIIQQGQVLQYLPYPTGYTRAAGKFCFESEGGHSAARVFRSGSLLKRVLGATKGLQIQPRLQHSVAGRHEEEEQV
ncbi:unnamed protein product, partial [Amoebophrya sp. A25]|eukprot:GSA25T00023297001.1